MICNLLRALMEAEIRVATSDKLRWEAEINALDRASNQAQRLSAEELASLRARESSNLSTEEIQRIWEHAEWHENHFRDQQVEIEDLRKKLNNLMHPAIRYL